MKNSHFYKLILGVLYTCAALAGPKQWGSERAVLLTPILWQGQTLSEVWINPDPELKIDRQDFIQALNPILTEQALKILKGLNTDLPYFTERQLRKKKFNIFFNPQELILELGIPKLYQRKQKLNMSDQMGRHPLVQPQALSSFLNIDASSFNPGQEQEYQSVFGNLNLNFNGFILNSAGYYNSSLQPRVLNREYTRLLYDNIPNRARYTVGDLNFRVSRLQDQIAGAGFSVQNEFSIQPELLNQRYNDFEIELKRASLVEIYLNEARVYSGRHQAGVLNLRDLPLILGMNNIIIHIIDQNGRRETLNFNQSYHQNVLPKGVSDYSISAFHPSTVNDDNQLVYENENYLSGFYRFGLRSDLTLEANLQAREDKKNLGLGASKSFSLSMWELYLNQACPGEDCQNAVFLGVQSQVSNSFRNLYFQMSYRNFERGYSSITDQFAMNRNQWSLNGVYGFNAIASLGLGLEEVDPFETEKNQYTTLEYGHRFSGRLSLSTRLRSQISGGEERSVLFSLNWNEMKGMLSGFHALDPEQNTFNNQININKRYASTHLYASANYDKNENESHRLFTELDTTRGALRLIRNVQGDQVQEQINLRFGITASPQHFNLGRFVNNSYIVLDSNSDSDVFVFNEFQTRLNKNNSLQVTDLTPYRINPFKLDINQLSLNEEIEDSLINVLPTNLSGSYYRFEVKKTRAVKLKLASKEIQLVRYKNGKLRHIKTDESQAFITGKNGLVFLEDIKPGSYQLQLDGISSSVVIEVPTKDGYQDLGVIYVD